MKRFICKVQGALIPGREPGQRTSYGTLFLSSWDTEAEALSDAQDYASTQGVTVFIYDGNHSLLTPVKVAKPDKTVQTLP